jgi:sodium/bile acid cotransporter 7
VAGVEVRTGIFYLCALPSTISSSVAMTALGRGNVAGAIFDATLSGLIGMVVTPALVALVADAHGQLELLPAILDVAQTLLLPFALGQAARLVIGGWVTRHKAWTGKIDRAVILLIVYAAFCESTAAGVWTRTDPLVLVGVLATVLALLLVVLTATRLAARALGFDRANEVAAVFCGSKKSLANGAPMAAILFGQSPQLGLIMLPVMLYHQAQLFVCTLLARRYAALAEAENIGTGAPPSLG